MACDVTILSTKYESNGNPAAIGFDTDGSYSYGLYQIATKPGTMGDFLTFLAGAYPAFHSSLEDAGGAQAALVGAAAFRTAWIACAAPATRTEFMQAQNQFAVRSYYTPSVQRLAAVGINLSTRACAIQNTIFSLSVMAGSGSALPKGKGACGLIVDAVDLLGGAHALSKISDAELLNAIYDAKLARIDQHLEYATVSDAIRASVRKRVALEKAEALALLPSE